MHLNYLLLYLTKSDQEISVTSESDPTATIAEVGEDSREKKESTFQYLTPSEEVAELLKVQDDQELWNLLLCSLLAESDQSGAYWLSRSLEHRKLVPLFPSWILKAAFRR